MQEKEAIEKLQKQIEINNETIRKLNNENYELKLKLSRVIELSKIKRELDGSKN